MPKSDSQRISDAAASELREWMGEVFPQRPADGDEVPEQVMQTDFSPQFDTVVSDAGHCLGHNCLVSPGLNCGNCSFNVSGSDPELEFEEPEPQTVFRSWHAPQQQAH